MTSNPNNLTTLVSALGRTNLSDTLNNFVNVTCLAPTNTAFNSAGSPDTSLSVPDLTKALKYHTISGAQYSLNLQDGEVLTSVGGPEIKVRVDANGTIWFNDAMVVQPNVITNNGVIHVLDRVRIFHFYACSWCDMRVTWAD
jgi:transforming growth factor-beta-induced protein